VEVKAGDQTRASEQARRLIRSAILNSTRMRYDGITTNSGFINPNPDLLQAIAPTTRKYQGPLPAI
jgi:hypothetical protein